MKAWLRRHWPSLRLRTLLFGIFVFVAGLPGVSAIFLRVYENTLVRQTESELISQGAALVAAAGGRFDALPRPKPGEDVTRKMLSSLSYRDEGSVGPAYFRPEPPRIDLNQDRIAPERPPPRATPRLPDNAAHDLAARMQPVIDQTGRTTLASIILMDDTGTILTGYWKGRSYAHVAEVKAALAGKTRTLLRRNGDYQARYSFEWLSRAAAVRVHHARPIVVNDKVVGVLLLSRSSRALFRGMYEDRGKIAVGVVLILLILLGLTALLDRTIARPIVALSRATRNVASGQGSMPETPATAALEIRALYGNFGEMAQAIARRSRYLKDFAAAVSHEFKTPLAGIRGGIELIEDHGETMSRADLTRFLGNISADADRLSALVSRLMDQARADMARPDASVRSDVGAIIARVADAMRNDSVAVETACAATLPPVGMAASTLETILIGLCENSIQAGAGTIRISATAENGMVFLTLSDDGPGLSEADRGRLFEPFFTTRRAEGGTGLGLSIAQSLIEGHGGQIEAARPDAGAAFIIQLPARPA